MSSREPVNQCSTFGQWLETRLLHSGHTERSLARAAGVSQQSVSRWRTGSARPSSRRLPALAKALGVSVDDLVNQLTLDIEARAEVQRLAGLRQEVEDLRLRVTQLENLLKKRGNARSTRTPRKR